MHITESREAKFYRKNFLSPVTFSLGILLFLLPFVDFKCNGVTITNATGIDLVAGRVNEKKLKEFAEKGNEQARFSKSGKTRPSPYAMSALVFAAIGLLGSLFFRRLYWITTVAGLCASLSMLALLIFVQNSIDHYIKVDTSLDKQSMKMSADFTFWYYISFFSFLVAAFFAFKRGRMQYLKPRKAGSSFLEEYNLRVNQEAGAASEGSSELA